MQPMAHQGAAPLFPPCKNCGKVAGFEDYPFAQGYLECKNCGHLENSRDLGDQFNNLMLNHSLDVATLPETPHPHEAADNIATQCPNCGSHTTAMMLDEDNNQRCHACGHIWKADAVKEKVEARTAVHPNPVDLPAADQQMPRDIGAEQDSSLTWKDASGQRLIPGQQYEMVSPQYELPDIIRVKRVKPDGIEIEYVGMYANEANPPEIRREDMEQKHLTFVPMVESMEGRGNEPPPGSQAPGLPPTQPTTDEYSHSFPQSSIAALSDPEEVDHCPKCGSRNIYSKMSSPTTVMHECDKCINVWETHEDEFGITSNTDSRSWLNESGDDDFFANMERVQAMRSAGKEQSRDIRSIAERDPRLQAIKERLNEAAQEGSLVREAGKKFTQREQRELIDEDGVARNSDLLNLEGTHYKSSDEMYKLNGDNAPDEHLIMGI